MDADAFRGDRYLRASAYHLLGWGIVGLGLTLPLYASALDQAWSPLWRWLFRAALGGAGVIWSFVGERRALKIAGPPTVPARTAVARLVLVVLALAGLGTVVLLAHAPQYIAALWLMAAAMVLATLGRGRMVPLYSTAAVLLATGAVVVGTLAVLDRGAQTPLIVVSVWNGLLVTVVIPCALLVNRRYLWRFEAT